MTHELDASEWPAPEEKADALVEDFERYLVPPERIAETLAKVRISAEAVAHRLEEIRMDFNHILGSQAGTGHSALSADQQVMMECVREMQAWYEAYSDALDEKVVELRQEAEAQQDVDQ